MNRLLTASDVAETLRISRAEFYRLRTSLIAAGLQVVRLTPDSRARYTAESLDALITKAGLRDRPIVKEIVNPQAVADQEAGVLAAEGGVV